jgi:hypothetical protein
MEAIDDKIFGRLPKIGSSAVRRGPPRRLEPSRLYVREARRPDADVSRVLFEKSQVKLRYEGRYGPAVLRPSAYVQIDLTA